ncbi:MAG: acetyl-CoA carboxylase carboxyltransferase subunit alpha [Candidatus Brocadiia bacterium]
MAKQLGVDFERPLIELETRISELKRFAQEHKVDLGDEISVLERRLLAEATRIYSNLTPWERVLVARNQKRPQTRDYLPLVFSEFQELFGDKLFADDPAIVSGFASIDKTQVMFIGQHKGRDIKERDLCHYGCPNPEGYRKALLKMKLAEKLGLPVLTFVDTKGAWCGIGAEERGQSLAIAKNLEAMAILRVPILCIVIGEGGSGGALGMAVGDRLGIMENAYFSVISPEGCAAILWRDAQFAPQAAAALKMCATDLFDLGLADDVIPEPPGGAHRSPVAAAQALKEYILSALPEILAVPIDVLLERRYQRLRSFGVYKENIVEMARISDPTRAETENKA